MTRTEEWHRHDILNHLTTHKIERDDGVCVQVFDWAMDSEDVVFRYEFENRAIDALRWYELRYATCCQTIERRGE